MATNINDINYNNININNIEYLYSMKYITTEKRNKMISHLKKYSNNLNMSNEKRIELYEEKKDFTDLFYFLIMFDVLLEDSSYDNFLYWHWLVHDLVLSARNEIDLSKYDNIGNHVEYNSDWINNSIDNEKYNSWDNSSYDSWDSSSYDSWDNSSSNSSSSSSCDW